MIEARVKQGADPCQQGAGTLRYPGRDAETGKLFDVYIPWTGRICGATPESVEILAPAGSELARLHPQPVWEAILEEVNFAAFPTALK